MRHVKTAVIGSAMVAIAGTASANILIAITSPTQYSYIVHKVPDFDQRRVGMPNNGNFYCVPTSTFNWFTYIANHGYPILLPGAGDWSGQGQFSTVTNYLVLLGVYMSTNPSSGTNLPNTVTGFKTWLGTSPYSSHFVLVGKDSNIITMYRFDDLAQQALLGRLVMPRIGWYDMSSYPLIFRNGGHLACMTAAVRNGSSRTLGLNDPASANGDFAVQSDFTREDYNIIEATPTVDGVPRLMSRVESYSHNGKGGWIDGYRAIVPVFGLTNSPDNTGVVMKKPFAFGSAQPSEVNFPSGGNINQLKLTSDALAAVVLSNNNQQQTSTLKKVDFVTGQVSTLLSTPALNTQIAVGRFGDIYMIRPQPGLLFRLIPGQADPVILGLPESVTAIAYDDSTDSVLLFAQLTRRLYRYPALFSPPNGSSPQPEIFQLPNDLSLDGGRFLTVSPVTGNIWYSTSLSPNFWEIIIPGDGSVLANPITAPNSTFSADLSIDDAGYMFFCDYIANVIRVYAPHQPGDTALVELGPDAHPLAGSACNSRFTIITSRNNFNHATADDPNQWDNVLPTEFAPSIPGCPADLDGNGVVDGTDLGLLLNAWGTVGFSDADLNSDGIVDGIDLGILLNLWGPCPGAG